MKGRYGPYVSDGDINATIPEGNDPMEVTLEQALALIAERAAKGGGKKKKKKAAPKPKKPRKREAKTKKPRRKNPRAKKKTARRRRKSQSRWRANNWRAKTANAPPLDKARLLALLAEHPGATKRDLARLLGLKGSDRIVLKRLLRELEAEGAIAGNAKRGSPRPANCPKSRCWKSPASTTTANCWPGR